VLFNKYKEYHEAVTHAQTLLITSNNSSVRRWSRTSEAHDTLREQVHWRTEKLSAL